MFVEVKPGETTDKGQFGDAQQERITKGSDRLDRKRVNI